MVKKAFNQFSGGVTFGGVSIGQTTARLGIAIDRGVIQLNTADELFCNRRLTGKVVLGHFDEGNGQRKLIDDTDHEVGGSFDVKGFRCATDTITTGLVFSLKEIDIAELAKFSKGQGRLLVSDVMAIPEDDPRDDEDDEDEDGINGSLKADGPWRDVPLSQLFPYGKRIHKSLKAAKIKTVGQLADFTAKDRWMTDIKGLGEKAVQDIEDRMINFWASNPQAADEAPVGK